METKFTKGEWFIKNLNDPNVGRYPAREIDISTNEAGDFITIWSKGKGDIESKANALLISKAPEMLEMLQGLLKINLPEYAKKEIEQLIKEATDVTE